MIRIKAFLPNPVGSDKDGEYIILSNPSNEEVDLENWSVKDESGKTFILKGIKLESGQEIVLDRSVTGLPLNNDGEIVKLLNPAGVLADELGYAGKAIEGQPVIQPAEISKEIRAELFDELLITEPGIVAGNSKKVDISTTSFLIVLILAIVSVYVLKK